MDISILKSYSVKIRFRHFVFVVDPQSDGPKISSDAIVLLNGNNKKRDLSRVAEYRIIISGAGEYEISGVKITGIRIGDGFIYNIIGDGLGVVLGKTKEISNISAQGREEFNTECQVVILNVDTEFTQSVITGLGPKIVILYGDNKDSGVKILGKENVSSLKKFTLTKDKLPQEMEVVVLG